MNSNIFGNLYDIEQINIEPMFLNIKLQRWQDITLINIKPFLLYFGNILLCCNSMFLKIQY